MASDICLALAGGKGKYEYKRSIVDPSGALEAQRVNGAGQGLTARFCPAPPPGGICDVGRRQAPTGDMCEAEETPEASGGGGSGGGSSGSGGRSGAGGGSEEKRGGQRNGSAARRATVPGRDLHSSTFQLNLIHLCH